MMKTNISTEEAPAQAHLEKKVEETPFEAVASICSVLVVGLFILTFLGQNFVIPSGSMENTLLVGDHLVVDRITLAPPTKWMPLVHYREPRRNDIVVFIKPGEPDLFLVKRLIGVPGDHLRLRDGIVYVNGTPQPQPSDGLVSNASGYLDPFLDQFPAIPPASEHRRHRNLGRRFSRSRGRWRTGCAPRQVLHDGRPSPRQSRLPLLGIRSSRQHRRPAAVQLLVVQDPRPPVRGDRNGQQIAWLGHVVVHFFSDTRWNRTLKIMR